MIKKTKPNRCCTVLIKFCISQNKFYYPTFFCNSQLYIMVVIHRIVLDVNNTLCQQHGCFSQFLIEQSSWKVTIMKNNHHQQQPLTSQLYTMGCKRMLGSKTFLRNENFSRNCTTSIKMSQHTFTLTSYDFAPKLLRFRTKSRVYLGQN